MLIGSRIIGPSESIEGLACTFFILGSLAPSGSFPKDHSVCYLVRLLRIESRFNPSGGSSAVQPAFVLGCVRLRLTHTVFSQ